MKYICAFFFSIFLILSISTFTDARPIPVANSYRLTQSDFDESYANSSAVEAEVSTPIEFALRQNFPNPFNPSIKISFSLPIESKVCLKIFDVPAKKVMTIVNQNLSSGWYKVNFDADVE